jgi:enoyl-CoA hydratase
MSKTLAETRFTRLQIAGPDAQGIVVVTLDRPERLNAMDLRMFEELTQLAAVAEADEAVRLLIITGAGRGFCAGLDLEVVGDLAGMSVQAFMRIQETAANTIAALRLLPKPVIAAVNGAATGGGLAVALAADVRLAAPEARFGVAFIRLGLSACDVGVSWLLPRVVGLGHASELMMTGRVIDAAAAERIGLVNRIVHEGSLLEAAHALAREIIRNAAFGLRLTKQGLQINVDAPSIHAAIELENRNQVLASRTEEMQATLGRFMGEQAAKRAQRS